MVRRKDQCRAGSSVTARPCPLDTAVAIVRELCHAGPHTIPYRLSQRASYTTVEFFCCQFTERLVDVSSVISRVHDVCSLRAGSTRRPNAYDGGSRAVREGRHKRGLARERKQAVARMTPASSRRTCGKASPGYRRHSSGLRVLHRVPGALQHVTQEAPVQLRRQCCCSSGFRLRSRREGVDSLTRSHRRIDASWM